MQSLSIFSAFSVTSVANSISVPAQGSNLNGWQLPYSSIDQHFRFGRDLCCAQRLEEPTESCEGANQPFSGLRALCVRSLCALCVECLFLHIGLRFFFGLRSSRSSRTSCKNLRLLLSCSSIDQPSTIIHHRLYASAA